MSFDLRILNNNLSINPDGSVQTVRDNSKLAQDVVKAVLTPLGSNRFNRWYGCTIGARTIGVTTDTNMTQVEAQRSIQDTLSNIVALQKVQARTQYVSPGETIASIRDILVLKNNEDPRQFDVIISVLTKQLTVLEETFTLII